MPWVTCRLEDITTTAVQKPVAIQRGEGWGQGGLAAPMHVSSAPVLSPTFNFYPDLVVLCVGQHVPYLAHGGR